MDLDRVAWIHGAQQPSSEKARQLTVQAGALSSALEHGVPEQMFSTEDEPVEAVSAVKAFGIANSEGQRIYRITQANQVEVLPSIHHDQNTMDEIKAALAAGKEVTTHTDPVSVPGWQGAGYVILDPETGAGAWKIGGGANGGILTLIEEISKAIIWSIATFVGIFKPFIETFSTAAAGLAFFISVLATVFNSSLNAAQKVADIAISLMSAIAVVKISAAIFSSALLFSAPLAAIGLMAVAILVVALLTIFGSSRFCVGRCNG
jgi:hypothetical protein